MNNKASFFIILVVALNLKGLALGAYSNYRPVKGLEPKENSLNEEVKSEIIIQKSEKTQNTVSSNVPPSSHGTFSGQDICLFENCHYISLGYSNPLSTSISKTSFTNIEKLGFTVPLGDKRYGVDAFYGTRFKNHLNLSFEVGISYDLAYFEDIGTRRRYGYHAVAPAVRALYNFTPKKHFSFYGGLELGLSILDFIHANDYNTKVRPKVGLLTGISYKIGGARNMEIFGGYRLFYVSRATFSFNENNIIKEYSFSVLSHNIQIGVHYNF